MPYNRHIRPRHCAFLALIGVSVNYCEFCLDSVNSLDYFRGFTELEEPARVGGEVAWDHL